MHRSSGARYPDVSTPLEPDSSELDELAGAMAPASARQAVSNDAPAVRAELMTQAAPAFAGRSLLATCVDGRHPTVRGRVKLRIDSSEAAAAQELWAPTLMHLPVREGDRVVLCHLDNYSEPVVMGVIDGFASRPAPVAHERAHIELAKDERICVRGADGRELLELFEGPEGPVVKLQTRDLCVEVPGKLRWKAEAIALEATQGQVTVDASENVVVRGEVVELN